MRFIVFVFLAPVLAIFGAAFGWSAGSETMLGLGGIAAAALVIWAPKLVHIRVGGASNVPQHLPFHQFVLGAGDNSRT